MSAGIRDRRWHGLDERRRIAHGPYGNMGEQVSGWAIALPDRYGAAPAQPGASRQHRLQPARAVRRAETPWGYTALDLRCPVASG
ncbi:hypothetical protein ABLN64_08110 [Mycobacterium tuberculosis]